MVPFILAMSIVGALSERGEGIGFLVWLVFLFFIVRRVWRAARQGTEGQPANLPKPNKAQQSLEEAIRQAADVPGGTVPAPKPAPARTASRPATGAPQPAGTVPEPVAQVPRPEPPPRPAREERQRRPVDEASEFAYPAITVGRTAAARTTIQPSPTGQTSVARAGISTSRRIGTGTARRTGTTTARRTGTTTMGGSVGRTTGMTRTARHQPAGIKTSAEMVAEAKERLGIGQG